MAQHVELSAVERLVDLAVGIFQLRGGGGGVIYLHFLRVVVSIYVGVVVEAGVGRRRRVQEVMDEFISLAEEVWCTAGGSLTHRHRLFFLGRANIQIFTRRPTFVPQLDGVPRETLRRSRWYGGDWFGNAELERGRRDRSLTLDVRCWCVSCQAVVCPILKYWDI